MVGEDGRIAYANRQTVKLCGAPTSSSVVGRSWLELDVSRPDELGVGHVDQAVAQDVLSQQDLALPALEAAEIHLGLGQHDLGLAQLGDSLHRDVHTPAAACSPSLAS